MAPPQKVSDDDILETIDMVRDDYGACTVQALADHLSISKQALLRRIEPMFAAGLIQRSELAGSIRRAQAPRAAT